MRRRNSTLRILHLTRCISAINMSNYLTGLHSSAHTDKLINHAAAYLERQIRFRPILDGSRIPSTRRSSLFANRNRPYLEARIMIILIRPTTADDECTHQQSRGQT